MIKWKKTDKHVYGAIYREHHKDLVVFGTCTAPEGNPQLGLAKPYILTEWGFRGTAEPIIKSIGRKGYIAQEEYDYEYYIAVVLSEDDEYHDWYGNPD